MIIENSELGYLHDKSAERSAFGQRIPLRLGKSEMFKKRHIYLHTFTFHTLGYNRKDEYNTLVISNL
jgi:hypothetical protein